MLYQTFPDGWYRLEINWSSNDDPMKSFPWKPLFPYEDGDYLVTFLAAKEPPPFRVMAMSKPFRFSAGEATQKDLRLKKLQASPAGHRSDEAPAQSTATVARRILTVSESNLYTEINWRRPRVAPPGTGDPAFGFT